MIHSLSAGFLVSARRRRGQTELAADLRVDTLHLLDLLFQLHASLSLRLELLLKFAYIGLGSDSGDARLFAHVTGGGPEHSKN